MRLRVASWVFALFAVMWGAGFTPAQAQPEPLPLSVYGNLPNVEDIALSPSGERLAMLMTASGERSIVVMDTELNPLFFVGVADTKVRGFDFVTDDLLLMERSTTEDLGYQFVGDQIELFQSFVISIDGRSSSEIFSDRDGVLNAVFGQYGTRMVNGRPTAFFGAVELMRANSNRGGYVWNHGRPALYAVDLTNNRSRRVENSPRPGTRRTWLVGAGGEVKARLDISATDGDWNIRGTSGTIASGQSPTGAIGLVSIGRDGSTIIYQTREDDSDKSVWYEVPIDGSAEPVEVFANESIDRVFRDNRTGQMMGYRRGSGKDPMVFFDPTMTKNASNVRRAFGSYAQAITDWTPSFGHVLVRISGNGDSGSHFMVDLSAMRAKTVAYERDTIKAEHVGPISYFDYIASDGLGLDGVLTLPPGREAIDLPVIVLPHGGPHAHDIAEFDWWAQAFASRGYAVFQPNFRGSTNRDQQFMRAGYGEWGGKMQSDKSDGLAALAAAGIVDPERACIVGASYGGYAALAGVTLQQGIYRCAVSVNGVADVNLLAIVERRESGQNQVLTRSLNELLGPRSRHRQISPRHNASQADAPILLIHGRDDIVVPFEQSAKMADALKDAGKPYQLLELEGEDHWLSLGKTRLAMLEASVAFVIEHNPPD